MRGLVHAVPFAFAFALVLGLAAPGQADAPESAESGALDAGAGGAEPTEGNAAGETAAEEAEAALLEGVSEQTDTLTHVQVGAYVMRISDLSQRDGRFEVDMWLWFRWQGTEVLPHETFEIVNGNIHERQANDVIDDQGFNYAAVRVQATVFHAFDVRRFPFDDHVITLEIEDSNLEFDNQQFVVDEGIAIDESVSVEGWHVSVLPAYAERHVYPTVYGYRSLDATTSSYSRLIVPIELARSGITPLFKLFWVSYLSVVLGLLAFRVRSNDLDARFGLGTGSVFAASANAFVVNEQLPQTTHITLAEQVNLLAVGTIFIAVFSSVASLRLRYAGRDAASEQLDRRALLLLAVSYVIANVVVMYLGLRT